MTGGHVELELGEEDRAFLQLRVRLFARVAFGIVLCFFLIDLIAWFALAPVVNIGPLWPHQWKGLVNELGIAAGLLVAAWVLKRGRWGVVHLFAFDGAVIAMVSCALAVLLHNTPRVPMSAELMVFLAIQTLLFLHAGVVPAPPVRTFLVHTAACAPLLYVAIDRASDLPTVDPMEKWGAAVAIAGWALVFGVVAAILSRILFRLRVSVRRAVRLGQYQLEQKLGEGGIGVVYRAKHALLRRPTAIKLLRREKVGEQMISRFEREVRATSRLTHPNTVAIFDYGRTPEGVFYYAMELIEGPNLYQAVEMSGPFSPSRVVHVLVQCAGALMEAHEMGLVHRDVKPENILLCRRGGVPDVVKVLDFGLVKDLESGDDVKLSHTGTLTGTPLYMPPEAITAPERVDGRADLYSLGAVAWFLLVGHPPFEGKSVIEVCAKHVQQPAATPSSAGAPVPPDLEAIVMRLLSKEPGARFPTALELEDALRACADFGRWTRRDADAWWSGHQHEVVELAHPDRPTALTIDVERS